MVNGKWLTAQILLLQRSPQTENLFNLEILAFF
jgi:hypothetical protein